MKRLISMVVHGSVKSGRTDCCRRWVKN